MWWNEPYEFCLCGVQLKTFRAHPAGDMFDAAAEVAVERRSVVWVTPAVNLYVVGVLVRRQTLSLDDVDNVGRVHNEQEWAQYGPLWHAELDDGRCRLLAAVTHMLPKKTKSEARVAEKNTAKRKSLNFGTVTGGRAKRPRNIKNSRMGNSRNS